MRTPANAPPQAFPTYTSLAQHLSSKHAGINSEDVKFLQLRGLVGPAGASGGETGAKPSKRSRAQGGVTLADLFAGPSLQEAAAASRAGASPSAGSLKHRGDRDKAGAKPSSTTLSFGSLLGRAAAAKPTRPAISKGKGAKAGLSLQQHKQHGALPRRGKLRWENAKKKQRVSHVKRLVLQVGTGTVQDAGLGIWGLLSLCSCTEEQAAHACVSSRVPRGLNACMCMHMLVPLVVLSVHIHTSVSACSKCPDMEQHVLLCMDNDWDNNS
eukprot:1159230-Pelagomonas_calceolata.AAC.7